RCRGARGAPRARALLAEKEERAILSVVYLGNEDRTAQRPAKLVALEGSQLHAVAIVAPGVGVQLAVAKVVVAGTVKAVRPAARGDVDDSASRPAVLRGE